MSFSTEKNAPEKYKTEPANPKKQVMMETFENSSLFAEARSSLQLKDIVIFFEFKNEELEIKADHSILKGLMESGIAVNVVKTKESDGVAIDNGNTAWAMHIRHLSNIKIRRKIVIYLETHSQVKDVENKQRALTSCTSQLILVHPK